MMGMIVGSLAMAATNIALKTFTVAAMAYYGAKYGRKGWQAGK